MEVQDGGLSGGDTVARTVEHVLVLPETLAETEELYAQIAGTIEEIKMHLQDALQKRDRGEPVNWSWYNRAKAKVRYMSGDLTTVKLHRRALKRVENRKTEVLRLEASVAKAEIAKANVEAQERIMLTAAAERAKRHQQNAVRELRREVVKRRALLKFIDENMQEYFPAAMAAMQNAEKKFDEENPK